MSEVPQQPTAGDPTAERTARLESLRAEVAKLEADLGQAPTARARTGGWWRTVVVACIAVLAIIAPLTVVATWAHDQVADTDRFVETVAPLAENPDIQAAISTRLTREIVTRIDVSDIVTEAADALED